jgi:thioesterase domain-containing protein
MIQHRAAANTLAWMQSQFPLGADDVVLQKTPFSFDVSVCELIGPLLAGARLVMARPDGHQDCLYLVEAIRRFGITQLHIVPSMLRLLVEEPGFEYCSTLKDVFAAGEALASDIVRRFHGRTSARLHNVYGPTETAIYATWWTCSRDEADSRVPIGRPIANTQAHVLDSDLNPVPVGARGELYLAGAGLAAGYLGRPELTAEKFVPNPYGNVPGMRLYKTGDLVRRRADGNVEFLGRADHQVKLRGFRIELGEIEAVLVQSPDVAQSVVMVREDIAGDPRLVAYVLPRSVPGPVADTLREFASARLPQFMVPSAFVFMDALPHTPAGKVDRRALPAPGQVRTRDTGFAASRDTLELQLVGIWQKVLGVRNVGVRDDFFELGGHSLLAIRLLTEIEKHCGKRLQLATLFVAGTIEHQAELIGRENWTPPWTSLIPIQPGGARPPFFCVHAHDGHVLYYRYLARWLGPDQPFYGLQARGLDGKAPPLTRVEDMAVQYLAEIRSLQPAGPYYLGANCGGGIIAFEMAQQLHRAGEQAALVALIDSHSPGCHVERPTRSARQKLYRLWQKLDEHLGHVALLPGRQKLLYVMDEIRWITGINPGTLKSPARNSGAAGGNSVGGAVALPPVERYTPSVYPGRLTLFRPEKQAAGYKHDPEFGWGPLAAGGVDVHRIPGYHGIIHEPRVRLLAEKLSTVLRETQEVH